MGTCMIYRFILPAGFRTLCFVINLLCITIVNGGHVLNVSGEQNAVRDLISETLRKWVRNSINNYFIPICTGPGLLSRYSNSPRAGLSGDRISLEGRDFPHPSRPALGPTQPPTQWVPGCSWGIKWQGRGVDHLPAPNAEVKERVELYLCSPCGHSWPFLCEL